MFKLKNFSTFPATESMQYLSEQFEYEDNRILPSD